MRFFAAIDWVTMTAGDGVWDVARRKALKAMSAEPTQPRVRAEALMGLIGELTALAAGSPRSPRPNRGSSSATLRYRSTVT
jgi:hypothetical protein